jgi:hypothetical protein
LVLGSEVSAAAIKAMLVISRVSKEIIFVFIERLYGGAARIVQVRAVLPAGNGQQVFSGEREFT